MFQIESTVKAFILAKKCSFFRVKLDFVYLMKMAQKSKKGSGRCATPKENIIRISVAVDEEHFLVFCHKILLFSRQIGDCFLFENGSELKNGSSGCATPKKNINRFSVDEEHYLVFWP